MKKKFISLIAALLLFHAPITLAEEKGNFTDLQPGNENFIAIQYLYEHNIVSGYPDGSFQPHKLVTRAEALKMILLAFEVDMAKVEIQTKATFTNLENGQTTDTELNKVPTNTTPIISFPDIDHSAWYMPFIEAAIYHKLVNGYEDQSFKPHNTINLAEALKISLSAAQTDINFLEVPNQIFNDVKKEDWFSAFALYGKDHEILDIAIDNTMNPAQDMTRGKLSELIYRIIKSKEGYGFGVASYYGNGADGARTASGQSLNNSGYQAAHKTLPFNTKVRVTNPTNGKFIDVTIVDRGPYTPGRVLDLTKAAFSQLDNPGVGVLKIHYQVLPQE